MNLVFSLRKVKKRERESRSALPPPSTPAQKITAATNKSQCLPAHLEFSQSLWKVWMSEATISHWKSKMVRGRNMRTGRGYFQPKQKKSFWSRRTNRFTNLEKLFAFEWCFWMQNWSHLIAEGWKTSRFFMLTEISLKSGKMQQLEREFSTRNWNCQVSRCWADGAFKLRLIWRRKG